MTAVLVANRGEIALRVFHTARRMGLRCIAVYSDADAGAPFVRAADHAIRIGPAPAAESYLRADLVVQAALGSGAELVHPGYGFLAEDPDFAGACERAGLVFVGPPEPVLRLVGDKAAAKRTAQGARVPVLPGAAGDEAELVRAAGEIGYPVIVKPAAGGGGKGMAVVRRPDELGPALASARRIAEAAFGDDRLILERYLPGPRHVEVQIVADAHGTVVHLGERDCSLQRRHQKILEETPSPAVDAELRAALCNGAVAFARAAGYVGAGTCEFLIGDDGAFGFIEMNARLQVEHPVTELVTGLDLVELQLRVAMGERLGLRQSDVRSHGHAVEVRVYAEDPDEGFLPQAGRVRHLRWPDAARVDAGIEEGSDVTTHYDPMLAKIAVHADDRAGALLSLERAISATEILGPRTNLAFLAAVTADPVVAGGKVTTSWLEEVYGGWRSGAGRPPDAAVAAAAAAAADEVLAHRGPDPWTALGAWRVGGPAGVPVVLRPGDDEVAVVVEGCGPFRVLGRDVRRGDGCHAWIVDGEPVAVARDGARLLVWATGAQHEIAAGPRERRLEEGGPAHLASPLPGQVLAVRVTSGDAVERGRELVVVEAMKMEHALRAPADGVVRAVLCAPGDQVDRGQTLVDFEPT